MRGLITPRMNGVEISSHSRTPSSPGTEAATRRRSRSQPASAWSSSAASPMSQTAPASSVHTNRGLTLATGAAANR